MTEVENRLTELLRAVTRGETAIKLVGEKTWAEASGNVSFVAGGVEMIFFNDCGDLDYLDSARENGVKIYDCETPSEWIFDLLTTDEYRKLFNIIKDM